MPPPQPSSGKPPLQRSSSQGQNMEVGYGQYDSRSSAESFLSALRTLPAPWLVGADSSSKKRKLDNNEESNESAPPTTTSKNNDKTKPDSAKSNAGTSSGGGGVSGIKKEAGTLAKSEMERSSSPPVPERYRDRNPNAMDVLGDLPADCLMAYYESRRRWIFGGSGLTTRGLMVEGVSNDGSNVQRCGANPNEYLDQSLLSLAGVGVSTLNATTVTKMGDYRERLLWSRSPVVGYGSNDSCGVAATTAADGSPKWSVDDDVMPMSFFDSKTGMFSDSVQTRVRARLMVNFGNAYKDKRASALVPEKFLSQCPSNHQHTESSTPQGSPPHDSFSSNVEEGEAIFTKSPPPKSPPHSSSLSLSPRPPPTTAANDDDNKDSSSSAGSGHTSDADDSSRSSTPPPPPAKRQKLDDGKPAPKPAPKQPPPQRSKAGGGSAAVDKASSGDLLGKSSLPSAPNTPPVAPPKMKSSPGSSTPGGGGGGPSPRPPPPPIKSQSKPSPVPPPKSGITKRPPPPPGVKRPAPPKPPSLDKRPAFNLAPQKPLPNVALRRPSSLTERSASAPGGGSSSSLGNPGSSSSSDSDGKKLPAPPKPAKLEATTSGGSGSSSLSLGGGGNKPPPPGLQKKGSGAPPPPPKKTVSKPPPPKPVAVEAKPLEYTNKDKRPDVDLPVGWMCVWSKSQRRWYFFDTRSNRSVWEWPPPK